MFSLHVAYIDEAMICLEMQNYASAKTAFRKAMLRKPSADLPDEDLSLSIAMIKLRLAYTDGDKESVESLLEDLISLFSKEQRPDGYAILRSDYSLADRSI